MLKPTSPLLRDVRRLALTTKQVNGGYYKGNRTGPMGEHTKHGGFKLDWEKVRTYVVPEGLDDCRLTPYVSKQISRATGSFQGYEKGALCGQFFLDGWKKKNSEEWEDQDQEVFEEEGLSGGAEKATV